MKYIFTLLFAFTVISGVAYGQQKYLSTTPAFRERTEKKRIENQPLVARPASPQDLPVTYIFTGNGNWNNPANWAGNVPPPQPTTNGSEIIINNTAGGQCLLNIPYVVTPGTSLTVLTGKNFIVSSGLIIN